MGSLKSISKSKMSGLRLIQLTVVMFFISGQCVWGLTGKAQKVFKSNNSAVYQIQVIDLISQEKSVIGSGFKFSKEGFFGTNYHVISDVVDKPDQFRIEYHRDGMKKGKLELVAIDVAHDLAILKGPENQERTVSLGSSLLAQGSPVFPMGNPLDVGMVILEGTFNGLIGNKQYQHILTSASLNPGMSGGPAFGPNGKVIGINVAIEGNDLSYLVPVEYLKNLQKSLGAGEMKQGWKQIIQSQILKRSDHLVSSAIKSDWDFENFGLLKVPKNIMPHVIKCWGKSKKEDPEKNQFYFYSYKWCESKNNVYLSSRLGTGTIGYTFYSMESESLNPLEFFKKFSKEYSTGQFYDRYSQEEVTEFRCQDHFIQLADNNWKAAYCVRGYQKYSLLHDVYISMAILNDAKRKFIIQIGISGVNEPQAKRFLKKFLGGIEWAG